METALGLCAKWSLPASKKHSKEAFPYHSQNSNFHEHGMHISPKQISNCGQLTSDIQNQDVQLSENTVYLS
jgi:hypothetical protein